MKIKSTNLFLIGKRYQRKLLQVNKDNVLEICQKDNSESNETVIEIEFAYQLEHFCSSNITLLIYHVYENQKSLVDTIITPYITRTEYWNGVHVDFGEMVVANLEIKGIL